MYDPLKARQEKLFQWQQVFGIKIPVVRIVKQPFSRTDVAAFHAAHFHGSYVGVKFPFAVGMHIVIPETHLIIVKTSEERLMTIFQCQFFK